MRCRHICSTITREWYVTSSIALKYVCFAVAKMFCTLSDFFVALEDAGDGVGTPESVKRSDTFHESIWYHF